MTTENADQLGTEGTEGGDNQAAPPSIEEVARSIGYRSKEEMKDPSKHVDAAEYIKRTADFNKGYRAEIKQLKRSIDGITATVSQVAVQKHAEGVREAEARLKAAKESFDPDAIENATVKLQQVKAATPQTNSAPPEVDEWCERNPWFDTDKTMKTDALEYGDKFQKRNPDATLQEKLDYIEAKIRKEYPDKFKKVEAEPRKGSAAGVEGVQINNTGGKEAWEKQEKELNDFERNTMNAMCEQMHNGKPIMTKKQYIESLAQSGRFGR